MMNSVTYLTRKCPRNCAYCGLRDAIGVGKELTVKQWQEAFQIIKQLGVTFNLILGNETWLLGKDLTPLMQKNKVPYALYSTAPDGLFEKYREELLLNKVIDNFSCGVDFPSSECIGDDDMYLKAKKAWEAFAWIKKEAPWVDCHATITIHKKNLSLVPDIIQEASNLGVHTAINYIHYNKDGGFDFFSDRASMQEFLLTASDKTEFEEMVRRVKRNPMLLQSLILLDIPFETVIGMEWHCGGHPYDGPTIDSDGTLRCCGYRKGKRTPQFTIFDLPTKLEAWKEAVRLDALDCAGCVWGYPIQDKYWKQENPEFGEQVFNNHAGHHIPVEQWSGRIINHKK